MQKSIIKVENKIIVTFPNGNTYECKDLSESDIINLIDARTEEEVLQIINPKYKEQLEEYSNNCNTIESVTKSSKILSYEDGCIYWKEVSSLSLPMDFAEKVSKAEKDNDELLLETYMNFWTLMSLNTDELCRQNLFKFLTKYGLKLARCGFFIAYRNAVFLTEEDGVQIFTDQYTHKMRIKIGEVVTKERESCNSDSNTECASGLHCAGASWLEKYYFGDTGLVCLVNPADVVAVPFRNENYGKLRTCAYLPIAKAKFGEDNHIIPFEVEDGFDCGYVSQVIYEGLMGTEVDSPYRIKFPKFVEENRVSITDRLLEIAKNCIVNRQL